jgi:hypothetical protein
MATVIETQDYLDEVKAPAVISPADVEAAVKAFVDGGAKVGQEAQLLARLLQAVAIAEPDTDLRGLMEEGFQKIGALQRESRAAETALRNVVLILREFSDWDAKFRAKAAELGYAI